MKLKQIFSTIFWCPISSKAQIERYQERIREMEWEAIKEFIPSQSNFLDVGCGAGFSLMKAFREFDCTVQGIDPEPGAHGVGRFTSGLWKERPIIQGSAEKLPFPDESFDVVYSSHVLEHVNSEIEALKEMKRVLKPNGILIIGMPTAAMTFVGVLSSWLFTTHISIYHFVRSIGRREIFSLLVRIILPTSHSAPRAKYVIYDLFHYRISNWKKTVGTIFKINQIITPGLYPYPDYIQWFPHLKFRKLSSSVFFISSK